MNVDVARAAIVLCLWPLTLYGLELLVFYRHPKRLLFALAAGLATAISALFFALVGREQLSQPGWLEVVVPACLFFLIGLLGSYIVPALEGTTFEEWIADAKRRSIRR